jgi:hypothetical protein
MIKFLKKYFLFPFTIKRLEEELKSKRLRINVLMDELEDAHNDVEYYKSSNHMYWKMMNKAAN